MSLKYDQPFAMPASLPGDLPLLLSYWNGLRRAANAMPFWDDANLSKLGEIAHRALLIDAFHKPQRFRFAMVGRDIAARFGSGVEGLFAEDTEGRVPFEYFVAQSAVTVELGAGTFYGNAAYGRVLLPMWGDGQIGMLLGGYAFR
jgi:hypothetical protein